MSPRRKAAPQLTRLELQIMNVLWDIGPSTVLQVQKKISGESLAYTTVQTMLNILHRKGRLRRKLLGKAYVYSPVLTRDHAVREVVRDIANRLFRGSVEALVMSLFKTDQITPKRLASLRNLLEKSQAAKHENARD